MEIRNHDLATTNETPGHLDGGDEADSKWALTINIANYSMHKKPTVRSYLIRV